MNQKNYMLLFSSLLMASYANFVFASDVASTVNDFDEDGPLHTYSMHKEFRTKRGASAEDTKRAKWAEENASKIAKYFIDKKKNQITKSDLDEYFKINQSDAFAKLEIGEPYMLGAINGYLEEAGSETDRIVEHFLKKGVDTISNQDFIKILKPKFTVVGSYIFNLSNKLLKAMKEDAKQLEEADIFKGMDIKKPQKEQFDDYLEKIIEDFKQLGKNHISWDDLINHMVFANVRESKEVYSQKFIKRLQSFDDEKKSELLRIIDEQLGESEEEDTFTNPTRDQFMYDDMIEKIAADFRRDGTKLITYPKILQRAKQLGFDSFLIEKLTRLSDSAKAKLIVKMSDMLPKQRLVARALNLANLVEKENKRQGRGFEDNERYSKHNEKIARVGRALDLAKIIDVVSKQSKETEEPVENLLDYSEFDEFKKYARENGIRNEEMFARHIFEKLQPVVQKLIDRDIALSTVTATNLGDIEDVTKEEFVEQAKKDKIHNVIMSFINDQSEQGLHRFIHAVIMQDRVAMALELGKTVETRNMRKRSLMSRDMYESRKGGKSVEKSLELARKVSNDSDSENFPPAYESGSEDDDSGMDERQNQSDFDNEDFDANEGNLSSGLLDN